MKSINQSINQSILIFCLLLFFSLPVFAKSSFSVTNTFGGDSSSISKKDLLAFNNFTNLEYTLADRIQLDGSNNIFTGRIRTTITPYDVEGDFSNITLKGYIYFHPNKYFGIAAGNSFFNKFALDSLYFLALDDAPNYGKLLNNGLGFYTAYDFFDISTIPLSMKLAFCVDTDSNYKWRELGFNFATEIALKNYFTAAATVKNVYDDENLSFAAGISQAYIKNLKFNIGYVYNNTDFDFLSAKTKHSVFLSASYSFEQKPFILSIDYVTGLNDSYISDKGVTKSRGYIPFTVATKLEYELNDDTSFDFLFKINGNIGLMEQSLYELLSLVDYKLNKNNTIMAGLRLTVDTTYKNADGIIIPEVSIPITWKFKLEN